MHLFYSLFILVQRKTCKMCLVDSVCKQFFFLNPTGHSATDSICNLLFNGFYKKFFILNELRFIRKVSMKYRNRKLENVFQYKGTTKNSELKIEI